MGDEATGERTSKKEQQKNKEGKKKERDCKLEPCRTPYLESLKKGNGWKAKVGGPAETRRKRKKKNHRKGEKIGEGT